MNFIPWQNDGYKEKKLARNFGDGINTAYNAFDIADSELLDSVNMCSDCYPDISVRNDRINTSMPLLSSAAAAIGVYNNEYIHVFVDDNWYYMKTSEVAWTQLSSQFGSTRAGKFVEYNTAAKRYLIFANANSSDQINYAFDGTSSSVSLTSNCPHSNMYVSHRYRLWGVDDNKRTLKFSALGDPTDWITSLNAGTRDLTKAKGPITALASYGDHIVVWTDNEMFEIYGNEPINFEVIDISRDIGCLNNNCWVECKGKLYFANSNGIYVYTGGMPKLISDRIKKYFQTGLASDYFSMNVKNDKVYFVINAFGSAAKLFLVYDSKLDKWHREAGTYYGLVNVAGQLYGHTIIFGFDNVNSTYKTGLDNSTAIDWYFETKNFNNASLDVDQSINETWLIHSGTTKATMSILYSTNDSTAGSYSTLMAATDFSTSSTNAVRTPCFVMTSELENQPWYRLKIAGTGYKRIHSLQMNICTYGDD